MIDITIQETVNDVDITVNQNVITVSVTRTTGSGGVESVNGETGVVVLTTDNVNEGLINLYFTAARVRATVLTGISFVSGIAITATDTILSAFGKLQKQISSLGAVAFSNNYNDLDNKPTIPTPQNLAQTLASDNKTNQIPITSNDGTSSVQIDNNGNLYLQSNFGGLKQILITEEGFTFQSNIRYDISGKGILMNTNSDGFGLPRLTTTQMNAIVVPTEGMIVRNTTEGKIYQFNGTVWEPLSNPPQTLAETLAVDNKTNDIPIISNNGLGYAYVNDDYTSLGYENQAFVMTDTEVQLYSDVPMTFDSNVSTDFNTPVFNYNSEEVATQPYADAKVANDLTASTTVAPSKTAVNTALDFTRRLITKGTGSVTGTVSETIITTLTVPANTLDSSCFIWTTMDFFKTYSGTVTIRLYINNANTLTGATLLGYSILGSNRNVSFNRKFLVTGTSLDLLTANTASIQVTNEFIEALYGASTVLTINPSADIFLIYTTQNDATGTVATNKMATVQKMKL